MFQENTLDMGYQYNKREIVVDHELSSLRDEKQYPHHESSLKQVSTLVSNYHRRLYRNEGVNRFSLK